MSDEIKIIRDPEIFSGGGIESKFRLPFEMVEGNFCSDRNSRTTPFQTLSPYTSTTENLSELVNIKFGSCDDVIKQHDIPVYKCSEDLQGNKYLLFKDVDPIEVDLEGPEGSGGGSVNLGLNITDKKNSLGVLNIVSPEGEVYQDFFGNVPLKADFFEPSELIFHDVQIYYDLVLLGSIFDGGEIPTGRLWLGNSETREFVSLDYEQNFWSYYKDGKIYILVDEFDTDIFEFSYKLYTFDGNELKLISEQPLTNLFLVSASMVVKNNRVEFVAVNIEFGEFEPSSTLVFIEYDLINNQWHGFHTIDFNFNYILGHHDDGEKWYIYYEIPTSVPFQLNNQVGGLCISFNKSIEEISTEGGCATTNDLCFEFDNQTGGVSACSVTTTEPTENVECIPFALPWNDDGQGDIWFHLDFETCTNTNQFPQFSSPEIWQGVVGYDGLNFADFATPFEVTEDNLVVDQRLFFNNTRPYIHNPWTMKEAGIGNAYGFLKYSALRDMHYMEITDAIIEGSSLTSGGYDQVINSVSFHIVETNHTVGQIPRRYSFYSRNLGDMGFLFQMDDGEMSFSVRENTFSFPNNSTISINNGAFGLGVYSFYLDSITPLNNMALVSDGAPPSFPTITGSGFNPNAPNNLPPVMETFNIEGEGGESGVVEVVMIFNPSQTHFNNVHNYLTTKFASHIGQPV